MEPDLLLVSIFIAIWLLLLDTIWNLIVFLIIKCYKKILNKYYGNQPVEAPRPPLHPAASVEDESAYESVQPHYY